KANEACCPPWLCQIGRVRVVCMIPTPLPWVVGAEGAVKWTRHEAGAVGLRLDCPANTLLDSPGQFLVTRRDHAHHVLGFRVVRTRRSDQNFLGAGSQLICEQ